MTRHRKKHIRLKSVYVWHRYLGISAAFFIIILSISGLLLNHSSELQLVTKSVTNNSVLNWYGITSPEIIRAYSAGDNWISQWDKQLYLNQQKIGTYSSTLLGIVDLKEMLVIAVIGKLILVTPNAEIIEVMDHSNGVPAGIKHISTDSSGYFIASAAHGYYRADADLLNWEAINAYPIEWPAQSSLPDDLNNKISQQFRQHSINYERLLLDIHSGRFFGKYGVYIMDAAAIILLLLSLSGAFLWLNRILKQKAHQKPRR